MTDETNPHVEAEVKRLTFVENLHHQHAPKELPNQAELIKEREEAEAAREAWIAANPGKPLRDYHAEQRAAASKPAESVTEEPTDEPA